VAPLAQVRKCQFRVYAYRIFVGAVLFLASGCSALPAEQRYPFVVLPVPTSTTAMTPTQLKFHIITHFGGIGGPRLTPNKGWIYFCDPDIWPVGDSYGAAARAREQFAQIQHDTERFEAILNHLGLTTQPTYTLDIQQQVYQANKELGLVELQADHATYQFGVLTLAEEREGCRIGGRVTPEGVVTITNYERVGLPYCPNAS
jgi:hypothetical protein